MSQTLSDKKNPPFPGQSFNLTDNQYGSLSGFIEEETNKLIVNRMKILYGDNIEVFVPKKDKVTDLKNVFTNSDEPWSMNDFKWTGESWESIKNDDPTKDGEDPKDSEALQDWVGAPQDSEAPKDSEAPQDGEANWLKDMTVGVAISDGNCMYDAVLLAYKDFLNRNNTSKSDLHDFVTKYEAKDVAKITEFKTILLNHSNSDDNTQQISVNEKKLQISRLSENKKWGTDLEIGLISNFLKLCIVVYIPKRDNVEKWNTFEPKQTDNTTNHQFNLDKCNGILYLKNIGGKEALAGVDAQHHSRGTEAVGLAAGGNHYEPIYPNENVKDRFTKFKHPVYGENTYDEITEILK